MKRFIRNIRGFCMSAPELTRVNTFSFNVSKFFNNLKTKINIYLTSFNSWRHSCIGVDTWAEGWLLVVLRSGGQWDELIVGQLMQCPRLRQVRHSACISSSWQVKRLRRSNLETGRIVGRILHWKKFNVTPESMWENPRSSPKVLEVTAIWHSIISIYTCFPSTPKTFLFRQSFPDFVLWLYYIYASVDFVIVLLF